MSRMNRRRLLEGIAGAAMVGTLGETPIRSLATPAQRDLIRGENEKPGSTEWLLTNTRVDPKSRALHAGQRWVTV